MGLSGSGHATVIDAAEDVGGSDAAPRPVELLLIAQGACTAMDVVSILKKKRMELKGFEVEVQAETPPEHPKYLTKVHLIYKFWGEGVSEEAVKRAIELSLEKYCTVANTIRGKTHISYEYKINESE
jgi:putative redox protein